MAKKVKQPLSLLQTILGGFSILLILSGFTLGILGFLRDFIQLPYDQNWIRIAENAMNDFLNTDLPWQLWGSILLLIGALIFTIFMNQLANEEDRLKEKAQRRSQRLQDAKIAE
jgi:hypothetical protein